MLGCAPGASICWRFARLGDGTWSKRRRECCPPTIQCFSSLLKVSIKKGKGSSLKFRICSTLRERQRMCIPSLQGQRALNRYAYSNITLPNHYLLTALFDILLFSTKWDASLFFFLEIHFVEQQTKRYIQAWFVRYPWNKCTRWSLSPWDWFHAFTVSVLVPSWIFSR